jgi:hypothetical protein
MPINFSTWASYLGLGQQVHREQLAGDARQQLRLHSRHAAEIVDLALEQGRQLEVLSEVLDIIGKLAGQQGRHPGGVGRVRRLRIGEQLDADILTGNRQPGIEAPRCSPAVVGGQHLGQVPEIPAGDAVALPLAFQAAQPRRKGRLSRGLVQQAVVPAAGHHLTPGVGNGQAHFQVVRQVVHGPGRRRNVHLEPFEKESA